jgi:hypothetical protein
MTYLAVLRSFADSSMRDEIPIGVGITYGAIRQGLAEAKDSQADLDEAVWLLKEWLRRYDSDSPGSWENYVLKHSTQYVQRTRAIVAKRGKTS